MRHSRRALLQIYTIIVFALEIHTFEMDPYIKNRICYVISGIILPHVLNPLFPLRTLFFSKIPLHPILASHPLDLQKKKLLYIHSHFLLAIIFSFTSLFRFCHFFFFCHLYKPFCFTIVPAIASFLLILQHCTTNWILTSVLSTILPTYLPAYCFYAPP